MGKNTSMPPEYPWPKNWRPSISGSSGGLACLIALIAVILQISVKPPGWIEGGLIALGVILAVFRQAAINIASSVPVIWQRSRYYGKLRGHAQNMERSVELERTHVETLVHSLVRLGQRPSLPIVAVRKMSSNTASDVAVVLEKRAEPYLQVGQEVIIVNQATAALLAKFQVVSEELGTYLAVPVSIREDGAVWWGYMIRVAEQHGIPRTEAVAVSL